MHIWEFRYYMFQSITIVSRHVLSTQWFFSDLRLLINRCKLFIWPSSVWYVKYTWVLYFVWQFDVHRMVSFIVGNSVNIDCTTLPIVESQIANVVLYSINFNSGFNLLIISARSVYVEDVMPFLMIFVIKFRNWLWPTESTCSAYSMLSQYDTWKIYILHFYNN